MEVGFVWKDHHLQGARMNLCQNWLVPEWAFSNRRWQKSVQGFLQKLVKMTKSGRWRVFYPRGIRFSIVS